MVLEFAFGQRFIPTDEKLITHYLWNKIAGNPLPLEGIMIEGDVYGENSTPWELFRDEDHVLPWHNVVDCVGKPVRPEVVLYVFTRLTRVGKIGSKQKNRVAGCGTWHGNNAPDYVWDGNGNKIGNKKTFKFRHNNKETATEWIMHEYSLLGCEDYVLCKIKRIENLAKIIEAQKRTRADGMVESTEDDVQRLGKKTRSDTTTSSSSIVMTDDTATTTSEIHCMNEGMNTGVVLQDQDIRCATTNEEANSALGDDGFLGINVGSDKNQPTIDHPGYSAADEDDSSIANLITDDMDMAAFLDEYLDCS